MESKGAKNQTAPIYAIQGGSDQKLTIEQISNALALQARQLMNLAVTIRSETLDQISFDFHNPGQALPGIVFAQGRTVEPDIRDEAGNVYRARRLRDTIFNDPDLFGEPAWDILLDLANASAAGLRISVSSACVGACVPTTTALRWISILEKKGFIEREDDLLDGRRTYITLSRKGLAKMDEYLRAARSL